MEMLWLSHIIGHSLSGHMTSSSQLKMARLDTGDNHFFFFSIFGGKQMQIYKILGQLQHVRWKPFNGNTFKLQLCSVYFIFWKVRQRIASCKKLKINLIKLVKHWTLKVKSCLPSPLGCLRPGLDLWESCTCTDASELSRGVTSCKTASVFWSDPGQLRFLFGNGIWKAKTLTLGITSATIWVHFPRIPNYYQVPAKCLLFLPLLLFSTVNSPLLFFWPQMSWSSRNSGWKITYP